MMAYTYHDYGNSEKYYVSGYSQDFMATYFLSEYTEEPLTIDEILVRVERGNLCSSGWEIAGSTITFTAEVLGRRRGSSREYPMPEENALVTWSISTQATNRVEQPDGSYRFTRSQYETVPGDIFTYNNGVATLTLGDDTRFRTFRITPTSITNPSTRSWGANIDFAPLRARILNVAQSGSIPGKATFEFATANLPDGVYFICFSYHLPHPLTGGDLTLPNGIMLYGLPSVPVFQWWRDVYADVHKIEIINNTGAFTLLVDDTFSDRPYSIRFNLYAEKDNLWMKNTETAQTSFSIAQTPQSTGGMQFSGMVWGDGPSRINPKITMRPNGIRDDGEYGIEGVNVFLYNSVTNLRVTTDASGNTIGDNGRLVTDADGLFQFNNIPDGSYFIVFEYDGINHFATQRIDGGDSHASEIARETFNAKFQTINYGQTGTGIPLRYYPVRPSLHMAYQARLITRNSDDSLKPEFAMRAKTDVLSSSSSNIDFGLISSSAITGETLGCHGLDLSLWLEARGLVIRDFEDTDVRFTVRADTAGRWRAYIPSRYMERTETIFRLVLNNAGGMLFSESNVNEVALYVPPNVIAPDFATSEDRSRNFKIEFDKEIGINDIAYRKYIIRDLGSLPTLRFGQRHIIYIAFLPVDIYALIGLDDVRMYAEIYSFSSTDDTIDRDSAPGNMFSTGIMLFEDDSDSALFPRFILDFETEITNNTVTITGYHGNARVLDIPSELFGLPVVAIGESAFADNTTIEYLSIPGSVETIGSRAFASIPTLRSVVIHEGVKFIGDRAFFVNHNADFTTLVLPSTLKEIEYHLLGWYPYHRVLSNFTFFTFSGSSLHNWLSLNLQNIYVVEGSFAHDWVNQREFDFDHHNYSVHFYSGISINTWPDRLIYNIGDEFDSSGLSLTLTFTNGQTQTITSGFQITGFNSATTGTRTVTVSYAGFTATFPVTINNAFTVRYNANGGTNAPATQTKNHGTALTLSNLQPIRHGFEFLGWSSNRNATMPMFQPGGLYEQNNSVTLYAIWRLVTYTISYNANGGTGVPTNQTKSHGTTLTLSNVRPTKTGYTFLGWSITPMARDALFEPGGEFSHNNSVTLYAVWQPVSYAVTFNANGGTEAPSTQNKLHGITLWLSSVQPVRTGYVFAGWSTDSNAVMPMFNAGGNFTANNSATLYAVWQQPTDLLLTLGDVNNDGAINSIDVLLMRTYAVGHPIAPPFFPAGIAPSTFRQAADVNGDGIVNSIDALMVNMHAVGHSTPPVGQNSGVRAMDVDTFSNLSNMATTSPSAITVAHTTSPAAITATQVMPFSNTVKVSIGDISGAPGEYVDVEISLDENPGLVSLEMHLNFDSLRLTPISIEGGGVMPLPVAPPMGASPLIFIFAAANPLENNYETGRIATVRFRINTGVSGTTAPISLTNNIALPAFSFVSAPVNVTPGTVTITGTQPQPTPPQTGAHLSVISGFARPGETVDVGIRLDRNPGFAGIMLRVALPPQLTLTSYQLWDTNGELLDGFVRPQRDEVHVQPGEDTNINGTFYLGWGRNSNFYSSGGLITLTLAVADNAPAGLLPVNLSFASMLGTELPTNYNGDKLEITITQGGVNVRAHGTTPLRGDANGDGRRTSADATLIARYIVGHMVAIDREAAMSISGGDTITLTDLTTFAGWLVGIGRP
ncbi:MAG: InlB B-repeat-containing protein [Defluviitaleaceae bacterium]|nr:InlB B-repeat-containing protein [Defluviitaleaceae bacterium]